MRRDLRCQNDSDYLGHERLFLLAPAGVAILLGPRESCSVAAPSIGVSRTERTSWSGGVHNLLQRIPWLWEFHKLHHSIKQLLLATFFGPFRKFILAPPKSLIFRSSHFFNLNWPNFTV